MPAAGLPPALLAALPPHPGPGELLAFQINGLVVVLVALALIWGMMEAMGAVFRRRALSVPAAPVAPSPAPPPEKAAPPAISAPPRAADAVTPAVDLVLIAAAVHATFGPRARIIALQPSPDAQVWAAEGRRQIFATHKVR